ncbi:hypothetical protein SAY86_020230 [Trapa natans]|uniref:Late embryogenesis abundant protein LEA-2 subgroup domain-containing protein n=1 Tax=Trapa natans TaxID=22666 RepID=A0AAN7R6B3_TRANT|nr:hypothetical protein SAY86_020230 [Trapa natans]
MAKDMEELRESRLEEEEEDEVIKQNKKVRTPKFRIGNGITIHSLTAAAGNRSSPSFEVNFTAPVRIKNPNFGPYKHDAATVIFTYGGVEVGRATVPRGKAGFRSTGKVDVAITVSSKAMPRAAAAAAAAREVSSSGVLMLNGGGKLNGKVELMLFFRKKKYSTGMNCTMVIDVVLETVKSLSCL